MMCVQLVVEAQVVHTERYLSSLEIAEPPLTTAEDPPMAHVRRLLVTGCVHGFHGADLTVFTSKGWARCSHMACKFTPTILVLSHNCRQMCTLRFLTNSKKKWY